MNIRQRTTACAGGAHTFTTPAKNPSKPAALYPTLAKPQHHARTNSTAAKQRDAPIRDDDEGYPPEEHPVFRG